MKSISRRSFVTTAAAGMAALGSLGPALPAAQGQAVEMASDWDISSFNQLAQSPARVKQLFDVVPLKQQALEHMQNSLNGLHFGFGIPASQIQIVAVSRGFATFFNFDDHIWQTYGIGALTNVNDPQTGKPAERNIFYPSSAGPDLKYASTDPENRNSIYNDSSIQALQHRGVRFLCCHNATYGLAHYIAEKHTPQQAPDQIYKDMVAHTLPGVMIVAAAVAAVALLQSEGHYSYLYV